MILDPSVFSGIADIHDRHRDMRLDVDNMSYEVKTNFHIQMHVLMYMYIPQCLFTLVLTF